MHSTFALSTSHTRKADIPPDELTASLDKLTFRQMSLSGRGLAGLRSHPLEFQSRPPGTAGPKGRP
jgi:hypothetical protein